MRIAGGAQRAWAAGNPRAEAEEGPGQALGAAIASATQHFMERMQAVAPGNEAMQEMMRGMVKPFHPYWPRPLLPDVRLNVQFWTYLFGQVIALLTANACGILQRWGSELLETTRLQVHAGRNLTAMLLLARVRSGILTSQ